MDQRFKRVKKVPHLYERSYQTAAGERRSKFYAIFTCKLRGKRRCLALGGDLGVAKAALKQLEADNIVGDGKDFDAERVQGMTFFSWTERFLQVKTSKRSLDKDRVSCERLKAFFGDCSLDSIVTSKIEAYKQKRLGEAMRNGKLPRPATVNRELACLRSMLILAARDRIIERVPYIELVEEKNQRDRVASESEFKALLEVSDFHLKEILVCLWDTGMRKQETLRLTWDRVDFKNDLIRLGIEDTKTKEARLIPISPRLRETLLTIWQREKGGKVARITERVFLFRGRPIDRFDRSFATACEKAKIEGLWIHDLRASFATRKIAEGFDRDWVKMITGHKTDHVFKRYNRPSIEALKAVVSKDQKVLTQVQQGNGAEDQRRASS